MRSRIIVYRIPVMGSWIFIPSCVPVMDAIALLPFVCTPVAPSVAIVMIRTCNEYIGGHLMPNALLLYFVCFLRHLGSASNTFSCASRTMKLAHMLLEYMLPPARPLSEQIRVASCEAIAHQLCMSAFVNMC